MPDHTVYWLKAGNKNYIGYTSNIQHRLRQHNGELQGGARRTKGGVWHVHETVSGFETKEAALRFEFALKRKKTDHAKKEFITASNFCALFSTTSSSPKRLNCSNDSCKSSFEIL